MYPGEVEVTRGSPVVYEGVQIGEVASVVLRHADPTQRARIDVTLEIDEPAVVLRDGDLFHLSHLRGVPIVEVSPTSNESQPITSGARVVGVPPLVTQIEETLNAALQSIGDLAVEAIERAFDDHEFEDVVPGRSAPAHPDADPPH